MAVSGDPVVLPHVGLLRRWSRRTGARGPRLGLGFGARLLVAIVLTLGAVGTFGYFEMADRLRSSQIAGYASTQRSDVRSLEAIGRQAGDSLANLLEFDQLLQAIAERDGVLETILIDPHSVVVSSGVDVTAVGHPDSDRRIDNALANGTSYAGLEADPQRDARDFEFVSPVRLAGGRYALEVGYDHRVLDRDLADVRRSLVLVGLLALLGGAGVFYLVGGRTLLRGHRDRAAARDARRPDRSSEPSRLPGRVSAGGRVRRRATRSRWRSIVLDLDDFKFLNDRHGHPHGDAVLTRVAEILRGGRIEDRAYRVGGDEFAMLVPHTDGDGARMVAARLSARMQCRRDRRQHRHQRAAARPERRGLHAEADAALYEAKRRGGDADRALRRDPRPAS